MTHTKSISHTKFTFANQCTFLNTLFLEKKLGLEYLFSSVIKDCLNMSLWKLHKHVRICRMFQSGACGGCTSKTPF